MKLILTHVADGPIISIDDPDIESYLLRVYPDNLVFVIFFGRGGRWFGLQHWRRWRFTKLRRDSVDRSRSWRRRCCRPIRRRRLASTARYWSSGRRRCGWGLLAATRSGFLSLDHASRDRRE